MSKELYEKYKGKKANYYGIYGIVCGYDNSDGASLIMALEGPELGWDLNALSENDFVDSTNVAGYFYIGEQHIIKDE